MSKFLGIIPRSRNRSTHWTLIGDEKALRDYLDRQEQTGASSPQVKFYQQPQEAIAAMLSQPADVVLCTTHTMTAQEAQELTIFCANSGTRLYVLPAHISELWEDVRLSHRAGGWALTQPSLNYDACWARFLRRTGDILFSSALLLTVFPVIFLVVALIIKRYGAGSVLTRAKRQDGEGNPYEAWFFRTRHQQTDEPFPSAKFLQRSHINEWPLLLNVLCGNMSFVGPQLHELGVDADCVLATFMQRHRVKPGITGWTRVHPTKYPTQEKQRKAETAYILHWSVGKDLRILWRTFLHSLL